MTQQRTVTRKVRLSGEDPSSLRWAGRELTRVPHEKCGLYPLPSLQVGSSSLRPLLLGFMSQATQFTCSPPTSHFLRGQSPVFLEQGALQAASAHLSPCWACPLWSTVVLGCEVLCHPLAFVEPYLRLSPEDPFLPPNPCMGPGHSG